jgi:5-methylcytosine-specific restriction enzyme A
MNTISAKGMWNGRTVPEWIGKTPDSKPPAHVIDRIFLRASKVCHISKREIRAGETWQVEHVIPIWKGGENRETNMAPALSKPHKLKTAREALERAEERVMRQKNYGIKKSRTPIPGSKASGLRKRMNGTVERRA